MTTTTHGTVTQRSNVVKERIVDCLHRFGGGRDHEHWKDAQTGFIRTSIRAARERGLRVWSEENAVCEQSAKQSLRYLLGETYSMTGGKKYTGRNEHWVLDVWEAGLDEIVRAAPKPKPEPDREQVAKDLETIVDDYFESGIKVIAEDVPGIADELLLAFDERNGNDMITLALKVSETRRKPLLLAYRAMDGDRFLELAMALEEG